MTSHRVQLQGVTYEMRVYRKKDGARTRVEATLDKTTLKSINAVAQRLIAAHCVQNPSLLIPLNRPLILNSSGLLLGEHVISKHSDTEFTTKEGGESLNTTNKLWSAFIRTLEERPSGPPRPETPRHETPIATASSITEPTSPRPIATRSPKGMVEPPADEVVLVPETAAILQPPLLSRSTESHPIIDHRTNTVDFSILQFKEKNPDWSLKSSNWYEKLPLTLRLRILRGIQEGHTPRNETSGLLCEAIRSHLVKPASTKQHDLIAKEITRLESLQKKSPLSPLLASAEKIYSTFKRTLSQERIDHIAYGRVLQDVYALTERVQKESPTAFASLQKIAFAVGVNLQVPAPETPIVIDATTPFLTLRFIEVLALWVDNEGSIPWEEKPKPTLWGSLTQLLQR